jgi:hypothetical protein
MRVYYFISERLFSKLFSRLEIRFIEHPEMARMLMGYKAAT